MEPSSDAAVAEAARVAGVAARAVARAYNAVADAAFTAYDKRGCWDAATERVRHDAYVVAERATVAVVAAYQEAASSYADAVDAYTA